MRAVAFALLVVVPLQAESLPRDLAKNFVRDQKVIWTKPLHLTRGQLAGVAVFSAATAALIATDRRSSGALPNTPAQLNAGKWVSNAGIGLEGILAGGLLIGGHFRHQDHMTETGFLAAEAAADAFLVGEVVKLATDRQRPYQDQSRGQFWSGGTSFPSGHSILAFSMAEVLASEYHEQPAIRIGIYGLATAISVARFPARKHFLSDILVGSTGGLLIGRYVWRAHHGEGHTWSLIPGLHYDPRMRSYSISLNFAR